MAGSIEVITGKRKPRTIDVTWVVDSSLFKVPVRPEVGDTLQFEVPIDRPGKFAGLIADAVAGVKKQGKPIASIVIRLKIEKVQDLGGAVIIEAQPQQVTINHRRREASTFACSSSADKISGPVVITP